MAVMLVYGIAAYIVMARKVRNAIWSERNVYHSDRITSPFVLLCIHWFNSLVWAAFYVMGRDMEMSCDEAVIGKMITEQTRMRWKELSAMWSRRRQLS